MVLWLTLTGPAAAAEFVDGIEDVPVMNGMHQVQSSNISFGNDEIRFVEAYLSGRKATFSSVAAFYEETLPQLGWHFIGRRNDSLHFERDAERLDSCPRKQITVIGKNHPSKVKIRKKMNKDVTSEIKNQAGIITINTADGLNVINRMMLCRHCRNHYGNGPPNDAVKAIVIRGSDKAFRPGSTLTNSSKTSMPRCWKKCTRTLKNCRRQKPVIYPPSAVTLGIGFELALACDIIFASRKRLLQPIQASASQHHPRFWRRNVLTGAVSKAKTMEMILTGPERERAREAERCGMVSRIISVALPVLTKP